MTVLQTIALPLGDSAVTFRKREAVITPYTRPCQPSDSRKILKSASGYNIPAYPLACLESRIRKLSLLSSPCADAANTTSRVSTSISPSASSPSSPAPPAPENLPSPSTPSTQKASAATSRPSPHTSASFSTVWTSPWSIPSRAFRPPSPLSRKTTSAPPDPPSAPSRKSMTT